MRQVTIIPLGEFYQRVDNAKMHVVFVGAHVVQVSLGPSNSAKEGWVATFPKFYLEGDNYVALCITSIKRDGWSMPTIGENRIPFDMLLATDELGLRSK